VTAEPLKADCIESVSNAGNVHAAARAMTAARLCQELRESCSLLANRRDIADAIGTLCFDRDSLRHDELACSVEGKIGQERDFPHRNLQTDECLATVTLYSWVPTNL
jgi:hypothetical protein